MPPSGYSPTQASSIEEFLTSCASSLAEEAVALGLTPSAALERECKSIRGFLSTQPNGIATGVLELTLAFYEALRTSDPQSQGAFDEAVQSAVGDARVAILAIHVPAPGALTSIHLT